MANERLDPAEALRQAKELGSSQQPQRGFLASADADADHATKIAHLPASHLMARVVRQPWIVDALDARLLGEPGSQVAGVGTMLLHAHRERLHATERQP